MVSVAPQSPTELKSGVFHLRSLTGLRFVAAAIVFVSHIQHLAFPEVRQLPLGGPAVSFFFVLSGFILTYVYGQRLTQQTVPRFWFTRWARLWPLHLVCFLIALAFLRTPPGSNPSGINSLSALVAQCLMLHSWLPIKHWFVSFNAVSWSISTELFFYLVFPCLLLGNRRHFVWKLLFVFLVGFGCLAGATLLMDRELLPAWFDQLALVIAFPLVRLAEFATGMAACLLMQHMQLPIATDFARNHRQYWVDSLWELIAVTLVILAWLGVNKSGFTHHLQNSQHVGPLYATWVRVAGGLFFYAFLMVVFASRRGLLGRVLASRLGVWLGEISFAFYLIHQIVIVQLNFMALNDLQFIFCSAAIALLAAAILYQVVEIPSRNALLDLYRGQTGWLQTWTSGGRQLLTHRNGLLQLVLLAGLITWLALRPVDRIEQARCHEIIANSATQLRGIEFFEEAILHGVHAEVVERGVRIRMVWQRRRSWSRLRFLHICDAQGNILSQGRQERDVFRDHDPNQMFVDEIILHKRKLKTAAYVAVGFWSPELDCARVANRPGEMGGHRVRILDLPTLKAVGGVFQDSPEQNATGRPGSNCRRVNLPKSPCRTAQSGTGIPTRQATPQVRCFDCQELPGA